jgi:hypothetical protein
MAEIDERGRNEQLLAAVRVLIPFYMNSRVAGRKERLRQLRELEARLVRGLAQWQAR